MIRDPGDPRLPALADYWHREEMRPLASLEFEALGHPVVLEASDECLLEAARISAGRCSRSSARRRPLMIRLAVDNGMPHTSLPTDWAEGLRCAGIGSWLLVNAEGSLNACGDMQSGVATALVSRPLSEAPHLLSRQVIDKFILNTAVRDGLGQLHASCLWREGKALLLAGSTGVGKSTTALGLALGGYGLLSDGMTYIRDRGTGLELLGYPVGESKLRDDVRNWFPELVGRGESVRVREEAKTVFDLRRVPEVHVIEDAVRPDEIVVCIVKRGNEREPSSLPITADDALPALWAEAAFVDERPVLKRHLEAIGSLLERSRCYELRIAGGTERLSDVVGAL